MITPSSIQYITQMLSEPQSIGEGDKESINLIKQSYPYFLPVRYMEAAEGQKKQPFSPEMLTSMQLYMGNWLQFCQFMQETLGPDAEAILKQAKPAQQENFELPKAEETVIPEVIELPLDELETVAYPEDRGYTEEHETEDFTIDHIDFTEDPIPAADNDTLIPPIYTEDYFLHQGIQVSNDIPDNVDELTGKNDVDKSLMVVMSFSEWLMHFKTKDQKEREEHEDKKALRTMWQKEKLAAAMEEENEEIPENVFEMAVNSITREDDLVSEALAEIHMKQGKYDKAIDMYRKLSLRNPQKNAYFARKIEAALKEKQ